MEADNCVVGETGAERLGFVALRDMRVLQSFPCIQIL